MMHSITLWEYYKKYCQMRTSSNCKRNSVKQIACILRQLKKTNSYILRYSKTTKNRLNLTFQRQKIKPPFYNTLFYRDYKRQFKTSIWRVSLNKQNREKKRLMSRLWTLYFLLSISILSRNSCYSAELTQLRLLQNLNRTRLKLLDSRMGNKYLSNKTHLVKVTSMGRNKSYRSRI